MFHSSSSSKSPNCSLDARSLALPSFHNTPSLISQQFLVTSASHCLMGRSDLKMRQASSDLPSNKLFHGPACCAAAGAAPSHAAAARITIDLVIIGVPFSDDS